MRAYRTALTLVLLALAGRAGEGEWHLLWNESFDQWPIGTVATAPKGWTVRNEGANQVEVVPVDGNRAVCLRDVVTAPTAASCSLGQQIPPLPGDYRISYRTMLRQGQAPALSQDMGLHLVDPGVLFDLFFSGGQLKTWQGEGWEALAPAVAWEADHWYAVRLVIHPSEGTAEVSVDGSNPQTVRLRRPGAPLTRLEFVSQRYATGELWIDDVRVEHRLPAELRSEPSQDWLQADPSARQERWYADAGSDIRWGKLRGNADGVAVARRLVSGDFTGNPILTFRPDPSQGADVRLYLRRAATGETVPLAISPTGQYALFAETGWDGEVQAELLATLRGKGSLKLGHPTVVFRSPVDYRDVSATSRNHAAAVGPAWKLPLEAMGVPNCAGPVQFGIPFPAGALRGTANLALWDATDPRRAFPLQTRCLSPWPDGSIRWLLVDSWLDLPATGRRVLVLGPGRPMPPAPVGGETEDSILLQGNGFILDLTRQGFPLLRGLPAPCDGSWDFVIEADGVTYRASAGAAETRLEDAGSVRATAVVAGTLAAGDDAPFRYELRISVRAGSSGLELRPTFLLAGDREERNLTQVSLTLGLAVDPGTITVGGDGPTTHSRSAGEVLTLCQDSLGHYEVDVGEESEGTGQRAEGWILAQGVGVAVRRFAEQHRKGFAVSDDTLRVDLWAPGGACRFGNGAAKTHDLVLAVGLPSWREAQLLSRQLNEPTILYPGGAWLARSGALGPFSLPDPELAELDRLYEAACERRITEAERRPDRSFGMVNYGETNHINSEIDAAVAFYLQWARTGQRKWLDAALDWSLHSQDIDVCQASPNPREIGIHHNHYPSDHNNGGLTLTHTWVRGQLFRYYLTGDQRSLIVADLAGRAFDRNATAEGRLFDGGNRRSGIGSRAYGRADWALCELYEATGNPAYLDTMERLNGYLAASLRPDGALPASHDGNGVWTNRDECPHMAAICAVGLARSARLLPPDQAATAKITLERIARWELSRGAMPDKLGIMYHNYPGGEVIHYVDASSNMLEAWQTLYAFTGNALYRDMAEVVYESLIEQGDRWQHDWTMGARSLLTYQALLGPAPGRFREMPPVSSAPAGADAEFLASCQNEDGGFGLAPGLPSEMDSTYRAVDALRLLTGEIPDARRCAEWILACRDPSGGYAGEPGWYPTVAWTCFALESLQTLGVAPPQPEATVAWLQAAFNADGGCGSSPVRGPLAYHPAWSSSTEYTAYAVRALTLLDAAPPDPLLTRAFLMSKQAYAGGFTHSRGTPTIGYTALALEALRRLPDPSHQPIGTQSLLVWLALLQKNDGGYGWLTTNRSNLRNTYEGLDARRSIQAPLTELQLTHARRYVVRCRAPEGGFGYRPGLVPTVLHTWYAVRAAVMLGPEPAPEATPRRPDAPAPRTGNGR